MSAKSELQNCIHRAHHYPTLMRRWRVIARKWGLVLTKYAEHDGFPLYYLRSRRLPKSQRSTLASIYLSTGIHGDEPGSSEGLIAWAEKYGNTFAAAEFIIFPCLNPWGLIGNIRTDASGIDLNRQFHNRDIPSIAAHRQLIDGRRFDLAMTLHEDYDGQGIYIYELNAAREAFSPVLLHAARKMIPFDPRRKIDGRRFPHPGYIHRNVRRLPSIEGPEALTLAREHANFTFTIETPSEFSLSLRIRAQQIIVQTAVQHVLRSRK